eukprot:CAMPEP_0206516832 /NCGR_PEP_ID=MMETSP0324_2-20121206/63589_1 /ASSEMBLY_ACC=CAM_ASM_000836 /TAXON_ID=2866 /ORGANISM="Crypthecodinium cohnii, Strain Seligo" /LENGTH=86 /DNA_ID=CAMNT_0054009815 /DNA_START=161 /DNA_END=421 /DNA_ORIENTATION=+
MTTTGTFVQLFTCLAQSKRGSYRLEGEEDVGDPEDHPFVGDEVGELDGQLRLLSFSFVTGCPIIRLLHLLHVVQQIKMFTANFRPI